MAGRVVAIALLAACQRAPSGSHAASGPQAASASLAGAWTGATTITQHTAGELVLRRSTPGWTAAIGAHRATLVDRDGWLRAALGDGQLRFRPATREAFWIQPGGEVVEQAFTTPLALAGDGDTLTARVEPLADELRMTIVVRADQTAFIREPNHNVGKFVGALTVTRDGDAYVFRDARDKLWLRATRHGETMRVAIAGTPMQLDVTRTTLPVPRPWRPHVPAPGDGWTVAGLAEVDLDARPIAAWIDQIRAAVPADQHAPAIQALVITRHGKLVVDEYFDGFSAETPHDVRSAGKSWSSTLAGILVDRGVLSLTTPLVPTGEKAAITLAHVLAMSTGLECDDRDPASRGNEDVMQQQRAESDWQRYALALPVVHPPGTRGAYCSAALNLVGHYIARVTREWIPAVWTRELAVPLGLRRFYLNLQPDEQGYLAGGMYVRARDFAKLAQVFLDGGRWNGTALISPRWIADATAPHASLNADADYGYAWWRTTLAGHPAFYASGNGGQLSIAIPDLDLTVTIMAGNYQDHATWRRFLEEDVPRYVIGAVTASR